jgi:myo-inositol catabolism protein IolC
MMLARLVLQDSHRPAVNMSLGCDATTCDHQHSQWQRVTQMNQQQGYKIHVTLFDDAGKIWCCKLLTDQQSTCCLSAVTPQRAIINIASAGR